MKWRLKGLESVDAGNRAVMNAANGLRAELERRVGAAPPRPETSADEPSAPSEPSAERAERADRMMAMMFQGMPAKPRRRTSRPRRCTRSSPAR